jgi:soluble lytic murein transglycosylase
MTMNVCWVAITRARWFSFLAIPALALAADPQTARLGRGVNAYDLHDFSAATQTLRGLQIPKLPDYTSYYLGWSELLNGSPEAAVRVFEAYRAKPVEESPLAGKIVVAHARSLINLKQAGSAQRAIEILKSAPSLPQPEALFVLGTAYEAAGDRLNALFCYRKAYYGYPVNDFAIQSLAGIEKLRTAMGSNFPEPSAAERLERARHLLEIRDYRTALAEYTELSAFLPEPARDEARAGVGAAQYLGGDAAGALRYLKSFRLATDEEDARRLYYLTEAARKVSDDDEMMGAIRQLGERYSQSQWRLKALLSAANRYIVTNDPAGYTPLYRAAFQDFGDDPATAAPHWRLAWDAYLTGRAERIPLMREQILRFPRDSRASVALYFLGRAAWSNGKYGEARAFYERNSSVFPHFYYAVLSRERLADSKLVTAKPDKATNEWLDQIDWGSPRDFSAVTANAPTRLRVERARTLMAAGLADLADAELRFGARSEREQPHLLAIELARSMPSPFNALRIMKSFSSDYLSIPFEGAPLSFWQMLFPLPYRDDIERAAAGMGLDPFSVAGLIRQETEFNPAAASGKKALGLMQLQFPTGREVGRRQGIPVPTARTLFDPWVNIRLGTAYLKQQLDHWSGDWTQTLAAYNAGPGRVKQWLAWGQQYNEPAEFIESIPFTETRDYVQAVLRNADMYRTLYAPDNRKRTKPQDVTDDYDTPPVYLTNLPKAARTPGGGMKAAPKKTSVSKSAVSSKKRKSTPQAKRPTKRRPGA